MYIMQNELGYDVVKNAYVTILCIFLHIFKMQKSVQYADYGQEILFLILFFAVLHISLDITSDI